MDEFVAFLTEYWFLIALGAVAILFAVWMILYFTRSKYAREQKEKREHNKFDKSMERIEKRMYKKCKKCGNNVPVDDRICQSCGQIPD